MSKKQRITISDVAERAGVSLATVSRVVNSPDVVTEGTRRRVQEVIDELGYRPSSMARGLSLGQSTLIAAIAAHSDAPSVSERLRGVASRLATSGYDLALFDVNSIEDRDRLLDECASSQRMAAALLISLRPTPQQLAACEEAGAVIVVIDGYVPEVSSISIDNVEGGRIAARHLLELGHQRVAFVGDDEHDSLGLMSSRDRRIGFEEEYTAAGFPILPGNLLRGPHGPAHAAAATQALLDFPEPPTAIFASSDTQAQGVLGAARSKGVAIPEQLSVIGFDDIKSAAALELTTVRQPLEESGRLGAELMMEYIEQGSEETLKVDMRLPIELVERQTTAPLTS